MAPKTIGDTEETPIGTATCVPPAAYAEDKEGVTSDRTQGTPVATTTRVP